MQLRQLKTILPPVDGMCKVYAISWSPNGKRLAVVTRDRVVHLFDENGERRDKFSTKPANKEAGPKDYAVWGLAFSPDSGKLAVAQSDNIVFVYKLGLEWGDKKSICNKFVQASPVTCVCWPSDRPNEVVFGLAEGKVKIGQLRSNKAATLYGTESYVVSLTHNVEGTAIISGHVDGSIIRYFFQDERGTGPTQQKLFQHSSVPTALAWGKSIVAAGADQRVVFYDSEGGQCGQFDYDGKEDVKEFSVACANPTGECVVLGNFNSFYVFNYNTKKNAWEQVGIKHINSYYTVSALAFKSDGSRLVVGNLCGAVDTFDACIRRYRYANAFELTYVALSQVIVKRLATGSRVVVKSSYNCEITKINIYNERYLVAHTDSTLLLGDLDSCKLSEIRWGTGGQGNEKFVFDSLNVCIVFCAGELSLIEYGSNEILGQVRTEYISGALLSVRINERKPRAGAEDNPDTPRQDEKEGENKKIAYLLDANTISVKDLHNNGSIEVQHDCKVDWLELNDRGNLLLFRDRRRQLHIFNCDTNQRNSLLNYCNYVQWVPESDVVVAQNRSNMNVWYNIMAPEDVTVYPIKGDIEEIERANGKTEVIVDEGITTSSYQLDEGLIAFGTAIDDRNYSKASDILEELELTPETRAMWSQLSADALSHHRFEIAERCAAALGDAAMCRFLHKSNKLAKRAKEEMQIDHPLDFWAVKARYLLLKKDMLGAEEIYLDNGKADEAIDMYNALHRYEDAIKVADSRDLPQAADMRDKYYAWLLESGQEEIAAELKEREGDAQSAISLYLKGGRPAKAAEVVKRNKMNQPQLLQQIATVLTDAGMHDKAGDFYVKLGQEQRGLQSYIDGKAFPQAIKLARDAFPQEIIRLEEMYGDYLVSQKQVDMAINHYIEAGVQSKAIEAALNSRQWAKVVNLLEAININEARPYHRRLARHYQEAGQLEQAEQHFINAAVPSEAVEMYTRLNKWESAHKVAITYMTEQEVQRLYINQATRKEALGQFKEAEQLYMTVNEPDLAINMYKKAQRYDQMVRLVSKHRKDLIKDTHVHLAQQLEMEGNLKEAENHYAEAGEWMSAVNMYRSNDLWDEAIRVAKFHGGVNASKRVAYAWALALGGDEGSKLLTKLGLIEPAIEYAVESGAFDHAYKLAEASLPKKLSEVYLKHALFLEDEERFKEAEDKFVKADKPKEAIDMYIHQQDWVNAMRVAEQYDPSSVSDVYVAQAKTAVERKEHSKAEQLYLTANKPDLALAMYIDAKMWQDARRVAKRHLPHKLNDVNLSYQRSASSEGSSKEELISAARMWEETRQYGHAIDAYLNIDPSHTNNADDLEQVWKAAVKLAAQHQYQRYNEVASEIAGRLLKIEKYGSAAELYKEIEQPRLALEAYMQGGLWDEARAISKAVPDERDRVEAEYQRHLMETDNAGALVSAGNLDAGLDTFARQGKWEKVFEIAGKEGHAVVGKYSAMYAKQLIADNKDEEAVKVLHQHGAPPRPENFNMYKDLAVRVIGMTKEEEDATNMMELSSMLRNVMFKLVASCKSLQIKDGQEKLEELLMASHYFSLYHKCKDQANMQMLACKISLTMLKYCTFLPADKMFYLAGEASKKASNDNLAFVLQNRYIDLSEAIDDGDMSSVDNSDFMDTNLPQPYEYPLPKGQYLDEASHEDIREWLLQMGMDQKVDQSLPGKNDRNRAEEYDGLFASPDPQCIVTGYPVPSQNRLEMKGWSANRKDWNLFVSRLKVDPWTGQPQKPMY